MQECNLDSGSFVAVSGISCVACLGAVVTISINQSINQPSTLLLKPLEDDELKWQICRSWRNKTTILNALLLLVNWLWLKLLTIGREQVAWLHQQWLIRQNLISYRLCVCDNLTEIYYGWWQQNSQTRVPTHGGASTEPEPIERRMLVCQKCKEP